MQEIRIVVPFTYSGTYVPPRKRTEYGGTFADTTTVLVRHDPLTKCEPLLECVVGDHVVRYGSVGDRIVRPVADPDGLPLDPASFTTLVEDPETDFAAWADYPFPRRTHIHHTRVEVGAARDRNTHRTAIRRENPRDGKNRDDVECREWIGDERTAKDLECHESSDHLLVADGIVMVDDALPRVEFDAKAVSPCFVVRTTSTSAEHAMLAKSKTTSYGSPVETDIVRIQLSDLPIVADVLQESDPEAAAELRSSVVWSRGAAPRPGEDVDLLRSLGARGIDRFARDLSISYVRDLGPAGLRRAADFLEAHAAYKEGRSSAGSIARAAIEFRATMLGTGWRGPDATTEFLLRLAVAVEILSPAAAADADAAALADLEL